MSQNGETTIRFPITYDIWHMFPITYDRKRSQNPSEIENCLGKIILMLTRILNKVSLKLSNVPHLITDRHNCWWRRWAGSLVHSQCVVDKRRTRLCSDTSPCDHTKTRRHPLCIHLRLHPQHWTINNTDSFIAQTSIITTFTTLHCEIECQKHMQLKIKEDVCTAVNFAASNCLCTRFSSDKNTREHIIHTHILLIVTSLNSS